MTKLLIEKNVNAMTPGTAWLMTVWYGQHCRHLVYCESPAEALRVATEWAESDAIYNQQGGSR